MKKIIHCYVPKTKLLWKILSWPAKLVFEPFLMKYYLDDGLAFWKSSKLESVSSDDWGTSAGFVTTCISFLPLFEIALEASGRAVAKELCAKSREGDFWKNSFYFSNWCTLSITSTTVSQGF